MHRGIDNYKNSYYDLNKIKERTFENRVVFLDINGVIMPSPDPQIRHDHENEVLKEYLSKKYNDPIYLDMKGYDIGAVYYDWNHIAIGYLRELLDSTCSNIVLSSNWRDGHPWEHLKAFFRLYDLDEYLIDRTPFDPRGFYIPHEVSINMYLDKHPEIKKYIVLDNEDLYKDFGENFRRIYHNGYGCISVEDYEYARFFLNCNPHIEISDDLIKFDDDYIQIHYRIIEESGYKLMYMDSIKCKYPSFEIDTYISYALAYIYKRMPEIDHYFIKDDKYNFKNLGIGYKDSLGCYSVSNTYDKDDMIYYIKGKTLKKG